MLPAETRSEYPPFLYCISNVGAVIRSSLERFCNVVRAKQQPELTATYKAASSRLRA